MLRWLVRLWHRLWHGTPDDFLEHVPVQRRQRRKSWKEAFDEAEAQHGKKFRSHTRVRRLTPPSRELEELNELSRRRKEHEERGEHDVLQLPKEKERRK